MLCPGLYVTVQSASKHRPRACLVLVPAPLLVSQETLGQLPTLSLLGGDNPSLRGWRVHKARICLAQDKCDHSCS